jgi:hypothetical protein
MQENTTKEYKEQTSNGEHAKNRLQCNTQVWVIFGLEFLWRIF